MKRTKNILQSLYCYELNAIIFLEILFQQNKIFNIILFECKF